jgi:hypothetical protein
VAAVAIYPNPAKHTLSIVNNGGYATAQIVSASGALLYACPIAEGKNIVDVNRFASGVYFVRLSASSKKPCTLKILVQSADK